MMMLALILAATWASLDGGSSRQFTALLGAFPSAQVAEDAAEADTPGSTNWYRRVETIRVPSAWDSPTNAQPRVDFVPLTSRQPVGDYNLQVTTPDGVESPFYEGQFDVAWADGYAMATDYDDFSCVDNYGFPLYRYKSHKLDKELYGAYFSAYNAYWERLYYGGQCDGVTIEDEDEPENFMLSPDKYFVRTGMAEDYHRLLEHTNIVSFSEHANEMFASLYMTIPTTSATEQNRNHPAFAYRQGWIADNSCSFGDSAYVYWASTMPPPLVEQANGSVGTVTPTELTLSLLPGFEWRVEAITKSEGMGVVESEIWQYYAITLAGLFSDVTHPIRHLFDNVGIASTAGDPQYIRNYFCGEHPRYDFMTNVYQFAGRACAHPAARRDEYDRCFGGYAGSLKNLPGAFVGFNQMLAVMDRLIYVPTVDMRYYNQDWDCSNEGAYTTDEEYTFSVKWDEGSYRYVIIGTNDASFRAFLSLPRSTREKNGSPVVEDWMHLRIGKVSQPGSKDYSVGQVSAPIFLDDTAADAMFAECGARELFVITGEAPIGNVLYLAFHGDVDTSQNYDHAFPGRKEDGDLVLHPAMFVQCEYQTREPTIDEWPYKCNKHLPGAGHDRAQNWQAAYLDRREWKYTPSGTADFITQYHSDGDTVTLGDWEYFELLHGWELQNDMIADAEAHTGRFRNPSLFAPLPPDVYFQIDGSAFKCADDGEVTGDVLKFKHNHYEDVYDCTMPLALSETLTRTNRVESYDWQEEPDVMVEYYDVQERYEETQSGAWIKTVGTTNFINGEYIEGSPHYWTNLVSETTSGGTNDYRVIFPKRLKDEIQFDEPGLHATNNYYEIDEITLFAISNAYMITRTNVPFEGSEYTTYDFDLVLRDSQIYTDYRQESVSQSSTNRVKLTGNEVIDLSTNVVERQQLTEVAAEYRVFRDHSYEHYYADPYVATHEFIIEEGQLPLQIGNYTVDVYADPTNAVRLSTGPIGFQGEYENKVKFAPIEAIDFDWSSMRLKEYPKEN